MASHENITPGIPSRWAHQIERILFSSVEIERTVDRLATEIDRYYAESLTNAQPLLAVGLLNGAFVFVADLLRKLRTPYQIDFMSISSYGKGTTSSGSVKCKKDVSIDPKGRHVLIIEDLIDTGHTLAWIKEHFRTKQCASVRICCMLDKKARREVDLKIDFCGYECPDEFVVGYGMDFNEEYRCMPMIAVLKPDAYAK